MFGQPDQTNTDGQAAMPADNPAPAMDTAWGQQDTATPADQPDQTFEAGAVSDGMPAPSDDSSAPADDQAWQHPGTPLNEDAQPTEAQPISDVISPAGGFPKPPSFPAPSSSTPPDLTPPPMPPMPPSDTPSSDAAPDLTDLKQQALQELAPLVDDLQQKPEDHFRTIMMLLQASDDQSLIPKAYAAAHGIEDEQVRAQALLDVVNEINYFTQPHEGEEAPAES